uniref:Glycoside hydrolase family 95 protein n=1 Tax=Rhodothermus marinus TaxID=29549 RepID=A0A7V2F7A8_RHOMR
MDRRDFLKCTGLALAAGPFWFQQTFGEAAVARSPFVSARIPQRGMYSLRPATRWEEALVAGNGTLGILVYGDPFRERIIFNHELLYEPLRDERVPPPHLAPYLPHIRALLLEGRYREAVHYSLEMAQREGWPGMLWTDPYHPAFALVMEMPPATPLDYLRRTAFDTGEIGVFWQTETGVYTRRAFVSRTDGVVVLELAAETGVLPLVSMHLEVQDLRPPEQREGYHPPEITAEPGWLYYRCAYVHTHRGYEGLVRVVPTGGTQTLQNGRLLIQGAQRVLLLARVWPLDNAATPRREAERAALATLPADYETLLAPHAAAHGSLFHRMALDLEGGEDRQQSSETLLAKQQAQDHILPALLEKLFDMGRYVLISSCGHWPPNLVALWTGEWRPPWSGDFTLDANLNLQMAAANIGALPEAVASFTRLIEGLLDDWRDNARQLYGCGGVLSGSRTDGRCGWHTHFNADYPLHFWTAGAGWLAHPMHEYVDVYGDETYVHQHLLPYLKEIAHFYKDFLTVTDTAGHVVFVPSYSPENHPGNLDTPGSINATMDIAVCREVLSTLIALCETRGLETENLPSWKALLRQLPPYLINEDGALKEWAHEGLTDHYNHRHLSHLYPVWPGHEITPEATPELFAAARNAAYLRGHENDSAHGLVHLALIGARLKDPELAYRSLRDLLRNGYLLPSLFSLHYPGNVYNADLINSLPAIVIEMLIYSRPGLLELLPAIDERLPRGTLRGAQARTQLQIDRLHWDLPARRLEVTLNARKDQSLTLRVRRGLEALTLADGTPLPLQTPTEAQLQLKAHHPVTLTLYLKR